jgi:hypothetical protein
MRFLRWIGLTLIALTGCGGGGGASGARIALPQVYPPVRANTPTGLIADPKFQSTSQVSSALTGAGHVSGSPQALDGPINLAQAIQERLYTMGPTEILRIVQELDGRTAELDTTPSKHACLTGTPVAKTISLPGGQAFTVQLQCIDHWNGGWIAFGFDSAQAADAGHVAAIGGADFYLMEGQDGGMGGAYHLQGATGDVEGFITVADSRVPNNSQVIMHLLTDNAASTIELTLAGSGVGFCSAHLKTGNDFIFIRAKTNGAAAPGTPLPASGQYCDDARTGCFATATLGMDLGGDAVSCSAIASNTFAIDMDLDASSDTGANVTPTMIYTYFDQEPTGIAAF